MAKKETEKPAKPAPVPYRSDSRSAYETMGRSLNTELLEQQAKDRAQVEQIRNVIRTERQERRGGEYGDPYIAGLAKKNPDQEFSVLDKRTGKWITVNKGMGGAKKVVNPTGQPNVNPGVVPTPIVSQPAPGVVAGPVPVAGVQPLAGVPAVSPHLPVVPGVPQAVVRQSSVAPVPYTPVNRVMAAVPQVTPKAVMNERMGRMGQRPEMGRDFSTRSGSSYSKTPKSSDDDGLFKF